MATRSFIFVKINAEDFGKVMCADVEKIPTNVTDYNFPCEEVTIPDNPYNGVLWLGVYCHWDGYPDGVGEELKQNYNSYEDALNLILFGGLSCVCNYVIAYHNWRNEPVQIYKSIYDSKPACPTYVDYAYYFEDGEWSVKEWSSNNGPTDIVLMQL